MRTWGAAVLRPYMELAARLRRRALQENNFAGWKPALGKRKARNFPGLFRCVPSMFDSLEVKVLYPA